MKAREYKTHLRNRKVLELIRKLEELALEARVCQEIFFEKNLNAFKKCEGTGGK